MAFQYLTNVPLNQAKEEYLRLLIKNGLQPEEETVPVQEACGRITSPCTPISALPIIMPAPWTALL